MDDESALLKRPTPEQTRERLLRFGVPLRHIEASKEFIPEITWKRVEGFKKGECLYISGPVGTGKTYLAVCLLRDKVENDIPSYQLVRRAGEEKIVNPKQFNFSSMVDILADIRDSYKSDGEYTEKDIIDYCSKHPCLVLDDIGVEKVTEWSLQTLYAIIDKRYRDMRQTVFTSNLSLKDLKDRLGERIPSRIAEMCGTKNIINLTGKDRRLGA
jgi:DNA replication protein DnaC